MATIAIVAILVLIAANCVYSLWEERKKGILCECSGDCANCKIQCRSNVNYYGTKQVGLPAVERRAVEKSLRPENRPLFIRLWRRGREIVDLICYWIFNIFGVIMALSAVTVVLGKIYFFFAGLLHG
jgi:hypothetical protein